MYDGRVVRMLTRLVNRVLRNSCLSARRRAPAASRPSGGGSGRVENAAGMAMSGAGSSLRSMSMSSGGSALFRTPSGRAAGPTSALSGRGSISDLGGAICGVRPTGQRSSSISRQSSGGGGGAGQAMNLHDTAMMFRSDVRSTANDATSYPDDSSARIARKSSGQTRLSVRTGQMGTHRALTLMVDPFCAPNARA